MLLILITPAPFVFMYLFLGFIAMEFNCKNWNECQKVIDNIISNRVKINIKQIKN